LDEALPPGSYGVTKIDVEGSEFEALHGGRGCLAAHLLRDVVFESTWDYPGPTHELLFGFGYHLFEIQASFRGPKLVPASSRSGGRGRLADYLATTESERAGELVGPAGWEVLRRRRDLKGDVVVFAESNSKPMIGDSAGRGHGILKSRQRPV
jgi:hypothetical protein